MLQSIKLLSQLMVKYKKPASYLKQAFKTSDQLTVIDPEPKFPWHVNNKAGSRHPHLSPGQ